MIKRGKWILLAVACVASLYFAAIIGVSIFKFSQYRASAVPIYPAPGHPQVSITSPTQGSQLPYGAPIIVEATAFSSSKVLSIELYLDGVLIEVQPAPPGGSDFFPAEFLFFPPDPCVYSLIARANGVDGLTTTSSPVQIMVTPPDFDPDAPDTKDSDFPTALPASADSSSPPAPDSPSNPAEDWNGTPGNWINSLTADAPPNAPELAASLDGCSVNLSIHDLSDNEEGFEVWRLLPNSPSWASIHVLASQSQDEWITYTDSGAHGGTTYYVSVFNSKGIQDSNLVSVNVDPVDCSPPSNGQSVLTLKLESLETHIPVDKLYCYVSLDGTQWIRRPEFGFWPRGDAAQEEGFLDVEIISLNLTAGDGSLDTENNPKTFHLDCWGWHGDSLHYLGAISPSLTPNQPGSNQFGSDGFIAEAALNLESYPKQPEFFPMGGAGDDEYEVGVFEGEIQDLKPQWFEPTIDPTMPFVTSIIGYSPECCKNHLPPPFQNTLGQVMFCFPYPGFDSGWGGVNPQPYLTWDPMYDMCMDGVEDPPCKPYIYWLSLAADLGHEMGFNIYDSNPEYFHVHHVTAPELFSFVIPVVPSSGLRTFWVQMWYYDSSSLLTFGPPSNKFSIPCPYKLGTQMALDIRFDALKLSNVDDGESEPQDVEVYGYLRASSESMTRYLNLADWNEQASACPDESWHPSLETGGTLGCPQTFTNGTYSLGDMRLCESKTYKYCSQLGFKNNNNIVRLLISEGDSLNLSVEIVDWDDASSNDLVCSGSFQIPGQSIWEWHKIKNQKFGISGSLTGSGKCQIKGVMNAVSPY